MSIKKNIFKIFNGSSWDEYYHKTSADQVVYTKPDGTASNVQTELAAQNSALKVDVRYEGNWTIYKYSNGIMRQVFIKTISANVTNPLGSGFYEGIQKPFGESLPESFTNLPSFNLSIYNTQEVWGNIYDGCSMLVPPSRIDLYSFVSRPNIYIGLCFVVEGYWK